MKTNVSINLTDEQRKIIHQSYYGKKGMISRKDVNAICQAAITDWLMGRADNRHIGDKVADAMTDNCGDDCCRRNDLLQGRVNRLQHLLDKRAKL